jgi:hypothetical protein
MVDVKTMCIVFDCRNPIPASFQLGDQLLQQGGFAGTAVGDD